MRRVCPEFLADVGTAARPEFALEFGWPEQIIDASVKLTWAAFCSYHRGVP
jgi:hypothetical protein